MRAAMVIAISFLIGAAGCVSASEGQVPDWADDGGYPSLHEVPRGTDANTDPEHWSAILAELTQTGETVRNHPRAEPASETQSPEDFLAEARRELEETRLSHEPN